MLYHLHTKIALQHLERMLYAIQMAPFVAVARVDAGADKTVPDIEARAERRLHVRAVVRVNVERVVGVLLLACQRLRSCRARRNP